MVEKVFIAITGHQMKVQNMLHHVNSYYSSVIAIFHDVFTVVAFKWILELDLPLVRHKPC